MRQNKKRLELVIKYIAVCTVLCIMAMSKMTLKVMAAPAADSQKQENQALDSQDICYTAFGDSIPNGYNSDRESEIVSYPSLIAEELKTLSKKETELSNFSRNGLTTTKLNSQILTDGQVIESLSKADLVTVTIGANDLMNQFKKVAQEILNSDQKFYNVDAALKALQDGISANPLLLVKVVGAIGGWDYASFEKQWIEAIDTITMYKPENCQLVVTTIYNPVGKMELPGTLNAVVENVIGKMNNIIVDHAEEKGYKVAELYDSGIGDYTQPDGLHPSQTGQNLIKELIENQLDIEQVTGPIADEEAQKEAKETAARAKAAKEEKEKQRAADRNKKIAIGLTALVLLCMCFFIFRKRRKKIQISG